MLVVVPVGLLLGYWAARHRQPQQPASVGEQPSRAGYEVFVLPSTEKVLPGAGLPSGATAGPARVSLARNEAESVQIVLRSRTALRQVQVEVGGLAQADGSGRIPQEAIAWSPVGFVKTKRPAYAVSHVGWWPDPLLAAAPFDVRPGWPQPIWVTVQAGPDTPPGTYEGVITIRPVDHPATHIRLVARVWGFALPATPSLQSAFDVYLNQLESGYSRFFPAWWAVWKSRPDELSQRFYDRLIHERLSPMLHLTLGDEGTLTALRRLREQGLSAFAIGRHGGSFDNKWPDEPAELARLESEYREEARRLREAGLLDRHYIYLYDEPEPGLPKVAEVARMIHRADPSLKTLVTLDKPFNLDQLTNWFQDIDIVCLRDVILDPAQAARLQQMGKQVWLYVSGPTPPYPSLVIDAPAMAVRMLPWMCWKYGLGGLLYWSVNYWTTDPYQEPMNTPWQQNGNGSLFYPGPDGPVSSIRLETLRDGMEDYEYLAHLSGIVHAARAGGRTGPALLEEAGRLLRVDPTLVASMRNYTVQTDVLQNRRAAVARMIERLQALLISPGS